MNSRVVKVKEIYEQNTCGILSSSVYILCNTKQKKIDQNLNFVGRVEKSISFIFVRRQLLGYIRNLTQIVSTESLYSGEKIEDQFSISESQTALIFNLKFANINFPRDRKQNWMDKFGHFPRTEKFFSLHQKILSGQQGSLTQ